NKVNGVWLTNSENSLNTICRVQAVTRQPQLYKPPESCQLEPEPLCASDGHTYPSECAMTATGVQKGISLRKIHAGACGKLGKRNSLKQSDSSTGLACQDKPCTYFAHFFLC
uniref:Kazal-like domain-containing protein n=1 Tax=Poecilia mexicana TaxID=48701 RepID=A0A3B3XRA4_9TELE